MREKILPIDLLARPIMNNIEISSIVVQVLKKIIQIQAHSCMLDHAGAAYIFLA